MYRMVYLHVLSMILLLSADAAWMPSAVSSLFSKGNSALAHKADAGQLALAELDSQGKVSRCWLDATRALSSGCQAMSDGEKRRYSVQLTNCHLAKSGRRTYVCASEQSVYECTRSMDSEAFGVYTAFFIQTDNICYYLQQELFLEETGEAVAALYSSTRENAASLADLNTQAERVATVVEQAILDHTRMHEEVVAHYELTQLQLGEMGTYVSSEFAQARSSFFDLAGRAGELQASVEADRKGVG